MHQQEIHKNNRNSNFSTTTKSAGIPKIYQIRQNPSRIPISTNGASNKFATIENTSSNRISNNSNSSNNSSNISANNRDRLLQFCLAEILSEFPFRLYPLGISISKIIESYTFHEKFKAIVPTQYWNFKFSEIIVRKTLEGIPGITIIDGTLVKCVS